LLKHSGYVAIRPESSWEGISLAFTTRFSLVESWSPGPEQPVLGVRDVHVWLVSLQQPLARIRRFGESLSADETIRAERFHFENDRRRFIVARGCLREILARYLRTAPGTIQFDYNDHGKPELGGATRRSSQLKFNLAHSGELAIYAITLIGDIGVDIERVRADIDLEQLAHSFFSASEIASLDLLAEGERRQAFFHCWARKEAFIKAKGIGLSIALNEFDVSLAADAELLKTRWDENEASRWSLQKIDVGRDYAAALSVAAGDSNLTQWSFAEG